MRSKGSARSGAPYGPVRLWGSATFIVGNFAAGYAADVIPARDLIWMIVAASALIALAALALAPLRKRRRGQAKHRRRRAAACCAIPPLSPCWRRRA